MESNREQLEESFHALQRAEAAPYVDYPRTPWWYFPAFGLWVTAFLLLLGGDNRSVVRGLGVLVLVAIELAFVVWYRRYHGALPSLRNPPAEFRPVFGRYVVGVVVLVAAITIAWLTLGYVVAAILAGVGTTVGLVLYEQVYAAAAARTKARLA